MAVKDIITIKKADGSAQSFVWDNVASNGDCFYESIARLINLRDPSAKESRFSVRTQIADYLYDYWDDSYENGVRVSINDRKQDFIAASKRTGRPLITADLNSNDLKTQYTDLVRIPEVFWADGVSIAAAAKLFDLNIVVVNNAGKIISGSSLSIDDTKETIYLNFVGGNHYRPLINLPEKILNIWWDNLYDSSLLYDKANAIFKGTYAIDIPDKDNIPEQEDKNLWNLLIADLRAKSDEELKKFYEEIIKLAKKSSIGDVVDLDQKQKLDPAIINNLFEGLIKAFSSPEFAESMGKLFVALFGVFRKIMLAFNPGMELDENEKAWPFKDQKPDNAAKNFYNQLVEIFDKAGEPGRKLYRSLLTRINQGEKLTSEQMLHELLKEVKNSSLFKKNGHEIMSKIEDLLCNDASKIEDRVERQLTDAFSYFYNIPPDDKLLRRHPVKDNIVCGSIIDDIKKACAALVKKIKDLKEKLTTSTDGLSESEKFNLWQILQTSRLKLSSCLLKIKAFSQGTTVLADGDFYEKFEKFSDKIADDLTLHEFHKAAKAVDSANGCADESKGKSILKLFKCLDNSKDIVADEQFGNDFARAVTKAKESRRTEIVDQIALINDRLDNKFSELQQFMHIFNIQGPAAIPFNNLIDELHACGMDQYEGEDISTTTSKDKFDPSGYKKIKELANKYDKKVLTLEGYADRMIANFNAPRSIPVPANVAP